MENATDALKMAAAMLIFVAALSLTITMLTQARQTSATVMENSDKNKMYYDNLNYTSEREVGIETVITNCYLYFKNYNTILFYVGHIETDTDTGKESVVIDHKLPLYCTESFPIIDTTSKKEKINSNLLINNEDGTDLNSRQVYGLDINDERNRKEPWISTDERNRNFVSSFLNAEFTEAYPWSRNNTDANKQISNYSFKTYSLANSNKYGYSATGAVNSLYIGFIYTPYLNNNTPYNKKPLAEAKNAVFVERIGTYKTSGVYSSTTNTLASGEVVNMSVYETTNTGSTQKLFIDENGTIVSSEDNVEENDIKRVIQYIYITNKTK